MEAGWREQPTTDKLALFALVIQLRQCCRGSRKTNAKARSFEQCSPGLGTQPVHHSQIQGCRWNSQLFQKHKGERFEITEKGQHSSKMSVFYTICCILYYIILYVFKCHSSCVVLLTYLIVNFDQDILHTECS